MKDKNLGVILAVAVIVFVVMYAVTNGYTHDEVHIGTLELAGTRSGELVTLINTTSGPTMGNYDSLDGPRGTAYQVPAGKTLDIVAVLFTPANTSSTVTIGHGTSRVSNTSTAPTNLTVLITTTAAGTLPITTPVFATAGAGTYPFVAVSGYTGTWPSDVIIYGRER